MAGGKSAYAKQLALAWIFDTVAYTPYPPPATYWLALFSNVPDENGGNELPAGTNNYGRKGIANTSATWGFTAPNTIKNIVSISTVSAAFGSWAPVYGFGLYDAQAQGNLWWYGALDTPVTIAQFDSVVFAPGALTFTED